jgi:hypothetical protein
MARVQEDPTKLLRGKVPWIYACYTNIEPVGHLIAKDVRPLECSFPYQTLLVKVSATETLEMLCEAFGEHSVSQTVVFECNSRFKAGRVSDEDDERSGLPSTSRTTEFVEKIQELIHVDHR